MDRPVAVGGRRHVCEREVLEGRSGVPDQRHRGDEGVARHRVPQRAELGAERVDAEHQLAGIPQDRDRVTGFHRRAGLHRQVLDVPVLSASRSTQQELGFERAELEESLHVGEPAATEQQGGDLEEA